MRGFDYYTGVVFELYDLNPANRRSVFGGGRYDGLAESIGSKIHSPGIGFSIGLSASQILLC